MTRDGTRLAEDALVVRRLTVVFPGLVAVNGVDLDVVPGEVHALCGQNGSGKSTLIKVLAGFHRPEPGASVTFRGRDVLGNGHEARMARRNMHFIHQDLGLIDSLDTVDNLLLGDTVNGRAVRLFRRSRAQRAARQALASLGVTDLDVTVPVKRLQPVHRAAVAIARASQGWVEDAGLLVLDEPTTRLPLEEVRRLFQIVHSLRDHGACVLYVSHRLDEVFEIADRVTVLRDGRRIFTRDAHELTRDGLVEAIVGRAAGTSDSPLRRATPGGAARLVVRGLWAQRIRDLSFDVRAGEVVGVTGLIGSGMETLPGVLCGVESVRRGNISLDGEPVARLTPRRAIGLGIALVPSDRLAQGCIAAHTIRENLTLPVLRPLRGAAGYLSRAREASDASEWAGRVELQRGSLERPLGQLSGGNQQKVLMARWLRTTPRLLVLHEPVQGVDVGAKASIYRVIADAAASGLAVLIVSIDTADLAVNAHRVLILHRGQCVDEVDGRDLDPQNLTHRLLSVSAGHHPR
jgi:ribose transport system ATP-binding protein